MTLLGRLALTILATAAPLSVGLAWVRADVERKTMERGLADFAITRMESGGREECEAAPEAFPEPLPPLGRRGGMMREGPDGPGMGPGMGPPGRRDGPPWEGGPGPRGPGGRGPLGAMIGGGGPPGRALGQGPGGPAQAGPGGPPGGGPPGGRVELWAYRADFTSANPHAPPFPADLRRALERDGRDLAGHVVAGPLGSRPRGGPGRAPQPPPPAPEGKGAPPPPPPEGKGAPPPPPPEGEGAGEPPPPPRGAEEALLRAEAPETVEVAVRMRWSEGPCAVMLARRDGAPRKAAWDVVLGAGVLGLGVLAAVALAIAPVVSRIRVLGTEVRRSARERYAVPVTARGGDEVADLAAAFNEAGAEVRAHVESLERREAALRAFVANTTHDVATPLTVLSGHLAALRKDAEQGRAADRDRVRDALEEAHYMASLLHNLGAAAKLEAGAPALERAPVDMNRLVERAVARHRPIAAERGVALDFAVPERTLTVLGDEVLLEQVASNAIQNAVRYNAQGGHVAVVLEERRGDFALRVVDDGPGVSEEELARLGERSFRGDAARTRHPEGKGIGLSIARDIATRHGFSLAFRRAEPRGLEVELTGARV